MAKLSIVGAGVIGLSTGILALERGYKVTVYTPDDPRKTISAKAAASFKPHLVVYNDRTDAMVPESWEHFLHLMKQREENGIRLHTHWEASSRKRPPAPYLRHMRNVEILTRPKVPGGYAHGWKYTTFLIDTSLYIPWLRKVFVKQGGTFVHLRKSLKTLSEVSQLPSDRIINCTGFGAKVLCNDSNMQPVKGQIVVVEKLSMRWSINADGFYIYPRATDTILGGTYEFGKEDTTIETSATELILRGNMRIVPSITRKKILGTYTGIRPYRLETIRVEKENIGKKRIIHNYGHGGAGITLSWGSAEKALSLL